LKPALVIVTVTAWPCCLGFHRYLFDQQVSRTTPLNPQASPMKQHRYVTFAYVA
jgi:hypothetical protein